MDPYGTDDSSFAGNAAAVAKGFAEGVGGGILDTIKSVYDVATNAPEIGRALKELAVTVVDAVKNGDFEALGKAAYGALPEELRKLVEEWDCLSGVERSYLIGKIVGMAAVGTAIGFGLAAVGAGALASAGSVVGKAGKGLAGLIKKVNATLAEALKKAGRAAAVLVRRMSVETETARRRWRRRNRNRRDGVPDSDRRMPLALGVDARRVRGMLSGLEQGQSKRFRQVESELEINALFDRLKEGAIRDLSTEYPGERWRFDDGTVIGRRGFSNSGGAAIDVVLSNKSRIGVHLKCRVFNGMLTQCWWRGL